LACSDQFSDDIKHRREAEGVLNLTRWVHVLLLDDLGKNKMTDRAEASLYELLEYRTSHRKPTIWTSNSNAKQLRTMFSVDRAEAIMRRLIEFSDIYTF
jgi:DNA replication protein DnaC